MLNISQILSGVLLPETLYKVDGWLVGWFYRRPHTSYSLLGVVQLPTDMRIYGDTHSSVLRVFREYFLLFATRQRCAMLPFGITPGQC